MAEDEFVSGDKFVFELDESVGQGRMTRSRRSSMGPEAMVPTKPVTKKRRQTMLPTLSEVKGSPSKQSVAVSPTKKFSKGSSKVLVEEDILSMLDSADSKNEVKPKTARTSSSKVVSKPKSPAKSRIPIKSPPSAAKKQTQAAVRRSRRVSGDAATLPPVAKPSSKRRQSMLPAINEGKRSPRKKISPVKKVPKSPVTVDVIKDVKKVEIRLKQMKIKEDPNLIYSLLEDSMDEEDRIAVVIDQILERKKENSPVTRKKKEEDNLNDRKKTDNKTPQKGTKTPRKVESKTSVKATATPKVETKTPKRSTRTTQVETPKQETSNIKVKSSPKVEIKATPKPETGSKKRKTTEAPMTTPVQNKRLKLDKSASKTPGSETKSSKTAPDLIAKYKQRTPIPGSLKKPLKRLNGAKSTPAQIKPSDVLRRNMIKKVETQIIQKMKNKPDSSPYTLKSGENSPVFAKVTKDVKTHITGTPARKMPRRKFGTTIQPHSLLEESLAPGTELIKRVSSSTPVRHRINEEPHPLESVEATPIRPPTSSPRQLPLSPPPEMVTGKLGKMCSIM